MSITVRCSTLFKTWVDCRHLGVNTSAGFTCTVGHVMDVQQDGERARKPGCCGWIVQNERETRSYGPTLAQS